MKPSLTAIDRFDESRVLSRFLDTFDPSNMQKIMITGTLAGFYVLLKKEDHYDLSDWYIKPEFQSSGLGRAILHNLFGLAKAEKLTIRFEVLRESRSNDFYQKHGFVKNA